MAALLNLIADVLLYLPRRAGHALGRLAGCLVLIILLTVACGVLATVLVGAAGAMGELARELPFAVYVLLDESNSNTDLGGEGSDPVGLRHNAARLLLTYLFVDAAVGSPGGPHLAALIHFGTTPQLTVPLAPLHTAGRAALLEKLAPPEPLGWTDHLAALTLALDDAALHASGREPVVVLFTDGKSAWDSAAGIDRDAYLADLRAQSRRLADMGGRLFIVLLASDATDADPEIATIWRPLWREMAAETDDTGGGFYEVRRPEDLPVVYHDIAADLTGHVVVPPVVDVTVAAAPTRHIIEVEPGLAGLTLVIAKSHPDTVAQVYLPDGQPLTAPLPGVRHAGEGTAQEIWQVEQPLPGEWTVLLSGQGRVLVWKDIRLASPTATAIAASATPVPTATTAPATWTPVPLIPATAMPATPIPQPTVTLGETETAESVSAARWLWLLLPLVAGAGLLWRLRGRQLVVSGVLRVLGADGEQLIDLEDVRRSRVTIGAPPADIVLPVKERFTLVPRRIQGGIEMVLGGEAADLRQLMVNTRAATDGQPLRDMDVIRCGDLRLRYENLALRPAEAWPDPVDDLEQLTY